MTKRRRNGHLRKHDVRRGAKLTLAALPSLIADKPPEIQRVLGRVTKSAWRDPTDTSPSAARDARTVSGWRRSCLIRRCIQRNGSTSPFKDKHVVVADIVRGLYDNARLGFSVPLLDTGLPVSSIVYRPLLGPSKRAEAQARAAREFARMWRCLEDYERPIIESLILGHTTIEEYCSERHWCHAKCVRLLVVALDRLVEYFDAEIDETLARGLAA